MNENRGYGENLPGKCKNENKKMNSQGTIPLKANQIMQIQNQSNEEQTTQHQDKKQAKK